MRKDSIDPSAVGQAGEIIRQGKLELGNAVFDGSYTSLLIKMWQQTIYSLGMPKPVSIKA